MEDAILALTTKSANDIAVVVAENIGGSVSGFAARMNRTARALGMHNSTFRNPHGLPDSGQVTTARDMARLGAALQDRFPTYYRYFGVKTFTYAGKRYRNHNRLLGSVAGVDGIKTGYTKRFRLQPGEQCRPRRPPHHRRRDGRQDRRRAATPICVS